MWCATFSSPNATWCVPAAWMIPRGVSLTRPRTGSSFSFGCRAGGTGLAGQVLLQPADVGGEAAVFIGCLADGGSAGGAEDGEQQRGVDRPRGDVGVPVPARAKLIA